MAYVFHDRMHPWTIEHWFCRGALPTKIAWIVKKFMNWRPKNNSQLMSSRNQEVPSEMWSVQAKIVLGSFAYVVLISTRVISKITVTHISTILRLIFVVFDNPAQRKRREFSKSNARAAMTTIHLNLIFAIFCRTIATIRNFAKLQPLSNVNPLVFLISLWLILIN